MTIDNGLLFIIQLIMKYCVGSHWIMCFKLSAIVEV